MTCVHCTRFGEYLKKVDKQNPLAKHIYLDAQDQPHLHKTKTTGKVVERWYAERISEENLRFLQETICPNLSHTTRAMLGQEHDPALVRINALPRAPSSLPRVGGGGATSSRFFDPQPVPASSLPRVGGGGATSSRFFDPQPLPQSSLPRLGGGGANSQAGTSSRSSQPQPAIEIDDEPSDDECIVTKVTRVEDETPELGKRSAPDSPESTECIVCMETRPRAVLVPCGHAQTCHECAKKLKTCPTCRARVTEVCRVFL